MDQDQRLIMLAGEHLSLAAWHQHLGTCIRRYVNAPSEGNRSLAIDCARETRRALRALEILLRQA